MRFIGDIHGKFDQYLKITDDCAASIQVGDFNIGFKPVPYIPPEHRFIRGNHDNPFAAKDHPNWIPDGHYENGMFFVGGGESIDRVQRIEGKEWWAEEQLSTAELYDLCDRYAMVRPRILVSHECPADAAHRLFKEPASRVITPSKTSQALGAMVSIHKPEMVIFGHWHQAKDETVDGVRYICLPELGWVDIV